MGYSGLCIQTNLSHCLGPFSQWSDRFIDSFLVFHTFINIIINMILSLTLLTNRVDIIAFISLPSRKEDAVAVATQSAISLQLIPHFFLPMINCNLPPSTRFFKHYHLFQINLYDFLMQSIQSCLQIEIVLFLRLSTSAKTSPTISFHLHY